ncbi:MAG: LytTR family DNA-binding domain-containing protein [Gammaproteobacteria bacterium]|jgi:hypothetical protein
MHPVTARQYESTTPSDSTASGRVAPAQRPPRPLDYFLYFLGIPVALAIVFSMVGIRLTYGMPYIDALVYMLAHMFTAWWSVNLGAAVIKYSFRSWRPPTLSICLLGVLISLIPAAFLFMRLGDFYATLYPVFAVNRTDNILPSWSLAYLGHFIRYSLPVVPTFLAGVYGYRYATGVDWFGYPPAKKDNTPPPPAGRTPQKQTGDPASEHPEGLPELTSAAPKRATAALVEGSKLRDDARLIAVKAEQHYIKIWSDQGTDLVRYRFKDLLNTLKGYNGSQVHRSWWIDLDNVKSWRKAGRKIELLVDDTLKVPVSLSHKDTVIKTLRRKAET